MSGADAPFSRRPVSVVLPGAGDVPTLSAWNPVADARCPGRMEPGLGGGSGGGWARSVPRLRRIAGQLADWLAGLVVNSGTTGASWA